MRNHSFKHSGVCVCANVQLIKNAVGKFSPTPGTIRPLKIIQVDYLRWAAHAIGLKFRSRIRALAAIFESKRRAIETVDLEARLSALEQERK